MSVYEKIVEIGSNFSHTTYVVFTSNGKTGRIIDFTSDKADAESYRKIGRQNGIEVEIAEYDPKEKSVYFF